VVDLRSWDTVVEDQGHLGSCTANAMVGMYEMLSRHYYGYDQLLSRLFVYYNSRRLESSESLDSGAYLQDVIQAVHGDGICTEVLWPYHVDNFAVRPNEASYADAKTRNIKNYSRLSNLSDILDALNNNRLILFGFIVFENFRTIEAPWIIDLPNNNDAPVGGHAMFLVGYHQENKLLLAKNSFGSKWADSGYCWFTFDYAKTWFVDMWTFDVELSQVSKSLSHSFSQ